jgi:hypothetical protein
LHPFPHAPEASSGQAKMEQPPIKKLQQLIFNAYSTNMYPISLFYIHLSMVNAEYNTKHKYKFRCGYLYRYPLQQFDLLGKNIYILAKS